MQERVKLVEAGEKGDKLALKSELGGEIIHRAAVGQLEKEGSEIEGTEVRFLVSEAEKSGTVDFLDDGGKGDAGGEDDEEKSKERKEFVRVMKLHSRRGWT